MFVWKHSYTKTIVYKIFLVKIIWKRNITHPIPGNDDRLLRRQFLPVLLFLFLGVIGVFGLFLLLLLLFVVYAAGASLGPAILPAALALKSENFKLLKLIFPPQYFFIKLNNYLATSICMARFAILSSSSSESLLSSSMRSSRNWTRDSNWKGKK